MTLPFRALTTPPYIGIDYPSCTSFVLLSVGLWKPYAHLQILHIIPGLASLYVPPDLRSHIGLSR